MSFHCTNRGVKRKLVKHQETDRSQTLLLRFFNPYLTRNTASASQPSMTFETREELQSPEVAAILEKTEFNSAPTLVPKEEDADNLTSQSLDVIGEYHIENGTKIEKSLNDDDDSAVLQT